MPLVSCYPTFIVKTNAKTYVIITNIMNTNAKKVGFLLLPGFALTSFSLAVEAFSVANELNTIPPYQLTLYGDNVKTQQTPVMSSNQVPLLTQRSFVSDQPDCAILFVCAYQKAASYQQKSVLQQLNLLHRKNCQIAALTSGSFILAKAGLLNHSNCTVLPEHKAAFQELYPSIELQENLFTINRNILTCAGGTSALDMVLYLIALDHGSEFAKHVSERFLRERMRSKEETQRSIRYTRLRKKSVTLGAAIELMEHYIEQPYSIAELARKVGTTTRTLEKLFTRHESTTPGRYYLKLRLAHALSMIEETSLPLNVITQATGFNSQSYFTKRFRETYAMTPREFRNQK